MEPSHEEYFVRWRADPREMDALWAEGWRHFGPVFFRYRRAEYGGRGCTVMPLRVDLARFAPSRSQRRVLAKNRDAEVSVGPTVVTPEMELMFERHRERFTFAVPDSLDSFLSFEPSSVPCPNVSILVRLGGRLAAASFLDVGRRATSAVYAMFDPAESRRSLGIFTMLEAIRYSRARGRRHYYPGYACLEPSVYDYKKNFAGLEHFDWRGTWHPLDGR
ncbi:MAG TPA: GNAT family N-acetyltransferase [Pyrinomonadaceae bacterium]|nr:GNAT family N-acetyltransferase [Pyrinomonadaceae bacterium]